MFKQGDEYPATLIHEYLCIITSHLATDMTVLILSVSKANALASLSSDLQENSIRISHALTYNAPYPVPKPFP